MNRGKASSSPARIGLYGGSFDPVHLGHLIGAVDAAEQCRLDLVHFIPAAQSPHKLSRPSAPAKDRLAMLRLAIKGFPRFHVCDWELRASAPRPSYTIQTVAYFESEYPGALLFWIIGADQLVRLPTWEQFDSLRRRVTFIVMERPAQQIDAKFKSKPTRLKGVISLPRPRTVAISSTEVRERLTKNLNVQHLVPSSVARYLNRHLLYQNSSCLPKR